jgi:hypothetical protein
MPGPFSPPQFPLGQAPTFDMGTLIPAVAATTTQQSADYYAQNFKGITVVLDVTSIGTASLTVSIQGKDSVTGKYFTLLASSAITANGTTAHIVYPGITPATGANANTAVSTILPAAFRVVVTAGNGNPATYTVGAVLTT